MGLRVHGALFGLNKLLQFRSRTGGCQPAAASNRAMNPTSASTDASGTAL